MRKLLLAMAAGVALTLVGQAEDAQAVGLANRWGARYANTMAWHGRYYNTTYGAPVALVVPPTARSYRDMAWGVSQNTVTPIYHQFGRGYPGEHAVGRNGLQPTPRWPSHTEQFGVYYVRGPW